MVRDHFSEESAIVEIQNGSAHFCLHYSWGGDHRILKDLLTAPRNNAQNLKRCLKLLPHGESQPLSEKLAVQWYYMTNTSKRQKMAAKMIEILKAYFQSINGTLERAEVDRLWNRTKRTLTSDLHEKLEGRSTRHACRESREHGHYDGHRLYYCATDDQCSHDGGRSGRDRRNNQPERRDHGGRGVCVSPRMGTISLCVWGLPICEFLSVPARMRKAIGFETCLAGCA